MSSPIALFYASLFLHVVVAMPGLSMGPMPTPMGLMASAGMSPRPTEAPGSNGIPLELRKRQAVQYPPPENWCGFVEGDYNNPLSCSAALTCVNSLDAIGCCTATTGTCTNLFTTCADYGAACDLACQLDPAIISCNALYPYCGTYRFPGGTYLYNCDSTSAPLYSMEFLNDYYVTAIGSTLASETTNPFGFIASVTQTAVKTTTATNTPINSHSTSDGGSGGGLSNAAIDGIAAAGAIVGIAILAIIVFFIVRLRKRRRLAAASVPFPHAPPQQQQPPPMQQQPQGPPPKAFDGYQSVPQQEQQVPQYTKYPSPPLQPQPQPQQQPQQQQQQQQQQTGYFPPPGPISPQSTGQNSDPRFSTTNTTLLSPTSETGSQRQSYYKAPVSPTVTEVDGTMGNPGAPDSNGHGRPLEVDGTMGNPGVPNGGHGIAHQGQAGGSPSAQEIDGRVGASMSKPFSAEGPYELSHEGTQGR